MSVGISKNRKDIKTVSFKEERCERKITVLFTNKVNAQPFYINLTVLKDNKENLTTQKIDAAKFLGNEFTDTLLEIKESTPNSVMVKKIKFRCKLQAIPNSTTSLK